MFCDERINNEIGRIYKRGILLATAVALIYGVLRAVYHFVCHTYSLSLTEIFIFVCGSVILILDAILYRGKDERVYFERHKFYLTAGKAFIIAAALGYAVTIPLYTGRTVPDMPVNHLIIILEVLGYIYFFYSFKNKDINFNYSFIAESKRTYYLRVLINIGKLALALFLVFSVSLVLDALLHGSVISLISIIIGYLISTLGLGLEYLFISVTEKVIYDECDTPWLKKGILIPAIALLIGTLALCVTDIIRSVIISMGFNSFDFDVGELLASISYLQLYMGFLITVLLAMTLGYVLNNVKEKEWLKRIIKGRLILSAVSVCWSFINSFLIYCFVYLIESKTDNAALANSVLLGFTSVASAISLAASALNGIICYRFHKDLGVNKMIMSAPVITAVCYAVMIYFNSQSMYMAYTVAGSIAALGEIVIPMVFVINGVKQKNKHRAKEI